MTQNPLDNIRKRMVAERPSFPNALYEDAVLAPSRTQINSLLSDAAVRVHMARIVDLVEVRTIENGDAVAALSALAEFSDPDEYGQQPLDHIENALAMAGGGRSLLASAPEEIQVAAWRIVLRSRVLDLMGEMVQLRTEIARQALGHLTTAVTVTSNGQMVQPTSLGHYFTGFLFPLNRVTQRLEESLARVNRSPLGAVSGVGTAVPARRERQADLLGFTGVADHTFDAIAAADIEYEIVSTVGGCALELSRLVSDLGEWSRDDTGTIVPSVEFVHSGGAQPQRRDPLILDHLRGLLAEQASAVTSLSMLLQSRSMIAGSATRERIVKLVDEQLETATLSCRLLASVMKTLEVNRALTANRTHRGFSTSSELADLLAIDCQLTRTEAYELAERIAAEASVLALGGMTLDTKLVDRMALEVIGREVGIEPETLGKCLSVKRFIERREVTGGPAPSSVRAMIEREHLERRRTEGWLAEQREHLAGAENSLDTAVRELLDQSST